MYILLIFLCSDHDCAPHACLDSIHSHKTFKQRINKRVHEHELVAVAQTLEFMYCETSYSLAISSHLQSNKEANSCGLI